MTAFLLALTLVLAGTCAALTVVVARLRRGAAPVTLEEPEPGSVEAPIGATDAPVEDPERSSEEHRQRVRLLEGVASAMSDGVVVVDRDGAVILRNDAAARYEHARHSDALAERAITEQLEAALRGQADARELEHFGPPHRVLRIVTEPLPDDGRIGGAVAFVRDISEARRVEAIRRDFVANVSHELKTPIGALTLLAETLSAAREIETLESLAPRVQLEAERLAHIVEDLLDLSLLEAQEEPAREEVLVADLQREAVDRIRPNADLAGIDVDLREPPARLRAALDRRWIVSALVNLLDNAVKYSDPASSVEISVEAGDGDEDLTFVVRDEGIGIPARDLDRIFERFYRVDRARSRSTGGTGLGLSIVRHVAEAHGGRVGVESTEGVGTTFRLSLPGALRGRSSLSEAS